MTKAIYEFEIYSNKGVEKVLAESCYKPLWQIRDEVERAYRSKNNMNSSIIVCLTKVTNVIDE